MSKQFSIALSIWARSILFNGLVSSFILSVHEGPAAFLVGIGIIIVAFIITAPLLAIITPVVKASIGLPYDSLACKAWLAFFIMLIAALFLFAFGIIFDLSFSDIFWKEIFIGTLISVLLATLTVRKSIDNYKLESYESNLV